MHNSDMPRTGSLGRSAVWLLALPILVLTFAGSAFAQTSADPAASTAAAPSAPALKDWQTRMARVPRPKNGCFTSSYPSSQWQEVPCVTAPARPYLHRQAAGPKSSIVGAAAGDVTAQVPTGTISKAKGSLDSVTGVVNENGTGAIVGPNAFSLQLNANEFPTAACNGVVGCLGWQQFIYSNVQHHAVFMEYALLGFGAPCPAGWDLVGAADCYRSSAMMPVPAQAIANLGNLSLEGDADAAGMDTLTLSVGVVMYTVQAPDNFLHLAQGWQEAEFNVLGDGGGSQANFNDGSTIVVRTSVNYDNGNQQPPACDTNHGLGGRSFSAETNNLNFAAAPNPLVEAWPAIVFTESGAAATPCASATPVAGGLNEAVFICNVQAGTGESNNFGSCGATLPASGGTSWNSLEFDASAAAVVGGYGMVVTSTVISLGEEGIGEAAATANLTYDFMLTPNPGSGYTDGSVPVLMNGGSNIAFNGITDNSVSMTVTDLSNNNPVYNLTNNNGAFGQTLSIVPNVAYQVAMTASVGVQTAPV